MAKLLSSRFGYVFILALGALLFLVIVGMRPDSLPFPPNSEYSDAAISHWSNALYLQRSIRAAEFPLWRPLLMSGQPFAANPLNKVWYPPQWLALILPPALHLNLLIWLHMLIAGLGMSALAKLLGIEARIACVIGIAYMLTPRLIAAIGAGHLDVMYAMSWSPAVLWALYRVITVTERSSSQWCRVANLAGLLALCFLADIRAFAVMLFAALGVGLLALTQSQRRGRALLFVGIAGLLALGLTTVQWLPLLELAPELSRQALTQHDSAVFSLELSQLIAVFFPVGSHETILYTGFIVSIMFLIGTIALWRRRQRRVVVLGWLLIVFAGWYALGINGLLWTLLTDLLPPLLWLRVPPRLWWIAVMVLLLLAGFGLQSLQSHRYRGLVVLIATVMIVEIVVADTRLVQFRPQQRWLDHYAPLAEALIADGVTKFYSPTYSLPQQVAAYWNIPDFGGIDPFQLRQYIPEFETATGTTIDGYTVTLPPFNGDLATSNRDAQIDALRLARWGVSHVLAAYAISDPDLELVSQIDGVYVYHNRIPVSMQPDSMCVGDLWCYQPRTFIPALLVSALTLLGIVVLLYNSKQRDGSTTFVVASRRRS